MVALIMALCVACVRACLWRAFCSTCSIGPCGRRCGCCESIRFATRNPCARVRPLPNPDGPIRPPPPPGYTRASSKTAPCGAYLSPKHLLHHETFGGFRPPVRALFHLGPDGTKEKKITQFDCAQEQACETRSNLVEWLFGG